MLVTEQHPGRVAVGGWCSRGEVSCPLGVVAVVVVCSRPGDKDEPGQRVTADPKTQNFFFSLEYKTPLVYINSVRSYGDWESVNERPSLRTLKFHGRFGSHAASCPVKGAWKRSST